MRLAQKRFNLWSSQAHGRHTTQSFAEYVNADYFALLDALTIARSRKHVAKYYGTETGTFPTRLAPRNVQEPIDSRGELPPIGELYDMISDLTFRPVSASVLCARGCSACLRGRLPRGLRQ